MSNTEKNANNSDGKRQTSILVGIAMIILAAVFAYFAVAQPTINNSNKNGAAVGGSQSQPNLAEELFVDESDEIGETAQTNGETHFSNAVQTSADATEKPTTATKAPSTAAPTQATTQITTVATTQATTKAVAPEVTVTYPLNLNTCTAEELMTINGIGEVRAGAIIAYREYLGGYTDVEQLKNIDGIGDGIFAKIEPYVTV